MAFIHVTADDNRQMFTRLGRSFDVAALLLLVQTSIPEISSSIVLPAGLASVVAQVVGLANQHGVLDRFLLAAAEERPHQEDLRTLVLALSQRKGWTAPIQTNGLSPAGLERLTSKGVPFLDVARLARWMIRVESQVCQVRCGPEQGTGFLVAPDLVLTNHHVVAGYLNKVVPATKVGVRFDYRVSPAGLQPDDLAPWEGIDATWVVPHRPHSAADENLVGVPDPTELDYAFLRLARRAGDEMIGTGTRGWVDISEDVELPAEDAPILIVQHPGQPPVGTLPQQPLKIAFATPGFERVNTNGTRVAYKPSTLKGSSGSPVFGPDYRAVALHHNRGQASPKGANLDTNNRGIPLVTIRGDLASRGDLPVDVLAMLVAPV